MQCVPIGVIRTPFADKTDAPIQGAYASDAVGTVELDADLAQGLTDLEGFTHVILLYAFDRASRVEMMRKPFLVDEERGLFSTRHPARPNPIGITVVRLESVDGAILTVRGVDMLDNTPLLDIKPYIPRFDAFPDASEGWLTGVERRTKPTGRE